MEAKFELKAGALVSLLIDSIESGRDILDEINYVVQDLDMTDDAYDITLALASLASTVVIVLSTVVDKDPRELWAAMMESDNIEWDEES